MTPYLDTSALAKWYVNEDLSEAVEEYLSALPAAYISSLTRTELRCLLARRRRAREISAQLESQIWGRFHQDIRQSHLRVLPIEDSHFDSAIELMDALPGLPLRTVDALHLAVVQAAGLESIATADRIMASAAEELGLSVESFLPSPRVP